MRNARAARDLGPRSAGGQQAAAMSGRTSIKFAQALASIRPLRPPRETRSRRDRATAVKRGGRNVLLWLAGRRSRDQRFSPGQAGGPGDEPSVPVPAAHRGGLLAVLGDPSRLAAAWPGFKTAGPGVGSLRIPRRARAAPRAPTCAVTKSDPTLLLLTLTCGFAVTAGQSCPDRGVNSAQAEVVSRGPKTKETALTSGYLLVEARSPLPGPTRRRPERQ